MRAEPAVLPQARPVEGSPCPSPRSRGAQEAKPSGYGPRGTLVSSEERRNSKPPGGSKPSSYTAVACRVYALSGAHHLAPLVIIVLAFRALDSADGSLLLESLIQLSTRVSARTVDSDIAKDAVRPALLAAVLEYVERQLHNPVLSVTEVAAHFGISKRYVHKLFQPNGESFSHHVLKCRLERAAPEQARKSTDCWITLPGLLCHQLRLPTRASAVLIHRTRCRFQGEECSGGRHDKLGPGYPTRVEARAGQSIMARRRQARAHTSLTELFFAQVVGTHLLN